jgi:GT2 family glycosyltransferase
LGYSAGETPVTTPLPKISCIIPTLDRATVLCETVRMLCAQTHPAYEIILVDQSPAHPATIHGTLAQWAAEGLIIWLHQREPNASKARNTGALIATGDVLLFLDDDIRIGPDFLAAYADALRRTSATGVSGPVLESEKKIVDTVDDKAFTTELGWLLHFRKNYAQACETSFLMSGNVAIKRDVFLELGGMDENYERGAHREESDFAMRLRQAGCRLQYDPKCFIYHLGPAVVPDGGARAGVNGKDFRYFHHCVGDWYFNLKFFTRRTIFPLLVASLRHFVFNRLTLERPWRLPFALGYWLFALPPAAVKRFRGPKLLSSALRDGTSRKAEMISPNSTISSPERRH